MKNKNITRSKKRFVRLHLRNNIFISVRIKKIMCICMEMQIPVFYVMEMGVVKRYPVTRSLRFWLGELNNEHFILIHKSYAVHDRYIDTFGGEQPTITFKNGKKLPWAKDKSHALDFLFCNHHPRKSGKSGNKKSTPGKRKTPLRRKK